MGKTYKDSRNFNPSDKPKSKKSQRNTRDVWKNDKYSTPSLTDDNLNKQDNE